MYLWDNADAVAVVFHGSLADRIEAIRDRVPKVRPWLWVDDGTGPCPDWAESYEEAAATATERVVARWGRTGDDILMIYTGGTTGMPKGVMWRQDDLIRATATPSPRRTTTRAATTPSSVALERPGPSRAGLPAHARHRLVHRAHLPVTGGSVVTLSRAPSTWTRCSTPSSASGSAC